TGVRSAMQGIAAGTAVPTLACCACSCGTTNSVPTLAPAALLRDHNAPLPDPSGPTIPCPRARAVHRRSAPHRHRCDTEIEPPEAQHMDSTAPNNDTTVDRVATALGWFSLALGTAQLLAPGGMARLVGAD